LDVGIAAHFARVSDTPLADAFDVKKVVPPFTGATLVPDEARAARWQAILDAPRRGKSLAYLHVPFCENHCLFCGFYQNPWRDAAGPRYVDAVIAHLARDADRILQADGPIHAVYFGGGTPSALGAGDLARLLRAVRSYLPLAPDCEITVEGRPRSFTRDKVDAALAAGANRFSIGVQTFDEPLRHSLGRKLSRNEVTRFLEELVATDAAAVVIDLMYGLPGQSEAAWESDVRTVIDLGLDGVDLYALNLIPGTPLRVAIDKGKFTPVPRTALGAYYAQGATLLAAARWETISTTHWRNGTRERNLYNLAIKGGAHCLAFGAGAGGLLDGHALRIGADVGAYEEALLGDRAPAMHLFRPSPHQGWVSGIKGEMDRGRLDVRRLARVLAATREVRDHEVTVLLDPLLAQWECARLLVRDGDWIDLTLAGCFWQVTMTQHLVDWLTAQLPAALSPPKP
jgi:oxygen-independent coproporphyrinogen-3 oxidase